MQDSNIEDVVHAFMEIDAFAKSIATNYEEIKDSIEALKDGLIDEFRFSDTLEDMRWFYINIQKIDEITKQVREYAVGVSDEKKDNIVRYDNKPHHNDIKSVKENNPPHHKHIGKDEDVYGFDGKLETMKKELERITAS